MTVPPLPSSVVHGLSVPLCHLTVNSNTWTNATSGLYQQSCQLEASISKYESISMQKKSVPWLLKRQIIGTDGDFDFKAAVQ